MGLAKDILLQQEWLKFAKLRLLGTNRLCLKRAEFSDVEAMLLQNEILRPLD